MQAQIDPVKEMSIDVLRSSPAVSAHFTSPRSENDRPRVIVDFTDIIGHIGNGGGVSGIPRTVFEFTNAALALERERNIDLIIGFFDEDQSKYFQLTRPEAIGLEDAIRDWLLNNPIFRRGYPRPINIAKYQHKYADRPLKRRMHIAYAQCRLTQRRIKQRIMGGFQKYPEFRELEFRSNDILLMLGSSWSSMSTIEHIAPLHEAGIIKTYILIYDLIPFVNLKNDDAVPAAIYEPWLERVSRMGCHFLAISEETKSDLLSYLAKEQIAVPPIRVIQLPHEFSKPFATTISADVQDLFSCNYALFVGPVSGRKNARLLLEAWAILLARIGAEATPILVISSGRGQQEIYETHIKPIESHVRLLNRPNDCELSQLYRKAAFTVFPSLYEGWGLPVGESLWHGIPCITSNCSSLPEVGGPLCDYVDPRSVDSIAQAAERLACDQEYRDRRAAEIKSAPLRTWHDFANALLDLAALDHTSRASMTISAR